MRKEPGIDTFNHPLQQASTDKHTHTHTQTHTHTHQIVGKVHVEI